MISRRLKAPRPRVAETPAHRRSKLYIASQLTRALKDASAASLTIAASLPCSNRHGQFFPCPNRIVKPFLEVACASDLSARTEHTDGASRFDVALVRERRLFKAASVTAPVPAPVREVEPAVPDALRQSIQLQLDAFVASKARELVLTGNPFERFAIHALAERAGLTHESDGLGLTRSVVISKRKPRRAKVAPLAAASSVLDTVAVFEILHTTPMTEEKVLSLNVPWIEVSTRDAEKWRLGEPLRCVATSLGTAVCETCSADPYQERVAFERVMAVVDVFERRPSVARHVFAQLRVGRDRLALVQHPLRLLERQWLPVTPVARLVDVPDSALGAAEIAAYLKDKLARFRQRAAHVDERLAQPVAPRELFAASDSIAQERDWHRPQLLLPSLDRVFGLGREWDRRRRRWTAVGAQVQR